MTDKKPPRLLTVRNIPEDLYFRLQRAKAAMRSDTWVDFLTKIVSAIEADEFEQIYQQLERRQRQIQEQALQQTKIGKR